MTWSCRARWSLLALVVVACGCTYRELRWGNDQFLQRDIALVPGETTAREVARAFGPPDQVGTLEEEFWYRYHYRASNQGSVTIRYYLDWIKKTAIRSVESTLILFFDGDGRLLHYASSGTPADADVTETFFAR